MTHISRKFFNIITCAALFFCCALSAVAETALPKGSVLGLPEALTVVDSDGNSVDSETGEYFFEVSDMKALETYTKEIQIMNLRGDKAYHIYFYAQPVSSSGQIDLENNCEALFSLDGQHIYDGKVTGEGNVDLRENPLDLGLYTPGQSKTMTCSVTWNGKGASGDGFVDFGEKLVTSEGTVIVREPEGIGSIYGEVKFKWIFYAVVDDEYVPPKTGVSLTDRMGYILIGTSAVGILIFALLILLRRRALKKGATSESHKENI